MFFERSYCCGCTCDICSAGARATLTPYSKTRALTFKNEHETVHTSRSIVALVATEALIAHVGVIAVVVVVAAAARRFV